MARIAILGAGALGCMYAHRIATTETDLLFIARDSRADRLARDGVQVNGDTVRPPVLAPEACGASNPDLLIVALKHDQLPAAAQDIALATGESTVVLSVMNGIESEQTIAAAIAEVHGADRAEHVLLCMVAGMDAVRDERGVTYTRVGRVFLGRTENDPQRPEAIVARAQALLESSNVPAVVPANARHALWNKWMLNCAINQWSAVLRAPYRTFHTSASARELLARTMDEVRAVAHAEGVELTAADRDSWFDIIDTLGPDGQTSMLQDVLAGRPTEMEMFAGTVCTLAQRHGLHVPLHTTLRLAIRAVEEA